MTMLLPLFVGCALVAIYSAISLFRHQRKAPTVQVVALAPPVSPPASPPTPSLPGMPPKYTPVPSTWGAVQRQLETPRAARGSTPPMSRLPANRFDQVLTTGLPVVVPPSRPPRDRDVD